MKRASPALTAASPDAYPAPLHTAETPSAARAPVLYSVPAASPNIAPPEFYAAARSGEAAALVAMLARGRFRASAAESESGRTALMLAAEQGHANVVAILTRGTLAAYIDVEDAEGNTALSLATASNQEAVVTLLRARGAGWNGLYAGPVPGDTDTAHSAPVLTYSPPSPAASTASAPQPGQTPEQHKLAAIFSAIDRGDAAGLRAVLLQDSYPVSTIGTVLAMTERRFVNGVETDDCTPLMAAAWLGRAKMVSALAHAGANTDQPNAQQMTPLMVAAKNGHANTVRALVTARARIDHAGRDGWTALMLAAYYGHLGAVQELLFARASVHRTTDDGVPPLSYAAMNGHADIVRALLQAGANSGFVSTHGHSALSLATGRQHAEVIELLRAHGAQFFRNWHI
jgi:ankyrin repeat protein